MTKNSSIFITLIAVSATTLTFANNNRVKIIYGDDNRVETYEASKRDQKLATASAGMVEAKRLIDLGEYAILPPSTIKDQLGLCEEERFIDQPISVICSAFLVAPKLMVTAGHCIDSQARCEEMNFIFDYKVNPVTKRADMAIPKSNVYRCKRVIESELSMDEESGNIKDYALIELDRDVEGVEPLKYRTEGFIKNKQSLVVIGHPSGLPQKVAGDANVFENNESLSFFKANLDTYAGNSGSAVFNDDDGTVEGILVRGAQDYIGDSEKQCTLSNRVSADISGEKELGEAVTRITDIPSLMLISKLTAAVNSYDLKLVIELIAQGADKSLLNIDMAKKLNSMYKVPIK